MHRTENGQHPKFWLECLGGSRFKSSSSADTSISSMLKVSVSSDLTFVLFIGKKWMSSSLSSDSHSTNGSCSFTAVALLGIDSLWIGIRFWPVLTFLYSPCCADLFPSWSFFSGQHEILNREFNETIILHLPNLLWSCWVAEWSNTPKLLFEESLLSYKKKKSANYWK